ncbi:hypothetical protein TRFO_22217 [Tritrichomonas foetus]|uniref:UDENN domain-containing protein n=1 Tax=Tritrichomonas foetus TaxID=1144522 RepID=A0A1J4KCA2_9EUKA|nr:hypothetical protein TRFO_22217 [Tritrichomonas foetus]|eukprot:OHT09047.1 hypothetical protein TRFO_22217 [Tritrichomonas foetus]
MSSYLDWDVRKFEEDLERQLKRRRLIQHSRTDNRILEQSIPCFDQFLIIGVAPKQDNDQISSQNPSKVDDSFGLNGNNNDSDNISQSSVDEKNNNLKDNSHNFNNPRHCSGKFNTFDGKPEILLAYPPTKLENVNYERIVSFSFPTGVKGRYLRPNGMEFIQSAFVFTVGCHDTVIYGSCIHLSLEKAPSPFYARNTDKDTYFALVILSRSHIIGTHLLFLTQIGLSTLMQTELFDVPESFPPFFDASSLLPNLVVDDSVGHIDGITVPEQFTNLLRSYFTTKAASAAPIALSRETVLYFPPKFSSTDYLLYSTLDTLFSLLSVEYIVQIYSMLLLDAQVLVIGSSLQEVSMTVLALHCLLRPFEFSGQVIPILPNDSNFLSLLETPTPFLIGIAPVPELKNFVFLDTAVFIHLDKKSVSFQVEAPYPEYKSVIRNLKSILRKEKCKVSHPFGYPDILDFYLNSHANNKNSISKGSKVNRIDNKKRRFHFSPETCNQIAKCLHKPIEKVSSDDIFGFFVTDMNTSKGQGTTVFNSELFLVSVKKNERAYYEMLLESQTFQVFIENRICDYLYQTHGTKGLENPMTTEILVGQAKQRTRSRSKSIQREILCTE